MLFVRRANSYALVCLTARTSTINLPHKSASMIGGSVDPGSKNDPAANYFD